MADDSVAESLVDQVESMYEDKEHLENELGVSDPEEIVQMVRSLQDQVESFYERHDES